MSQQFIIRKPMLSDAGALINYMKEVDSETRFLAREPGEFSFTLEQEEDFLKRLEENDSMVFYVAEMDGELVGNCLVGSISNSLRSKIDRH